MRIKQFLVVLLVVPFSYTLASEPIFLKNRVIHPQTYKKEMLSVFRVLDPIQKKTVMVQFESPISEALKQKLALNGLRSLAYIPDNTLILSLNKTNLMWLLNNIKVSWIEPYLLIDKVSKNFEKVSVFDEDETLNVSIRFFNDSGKNELIRYLNNKNQYIAASFQKFLIAKIEKKYLYSIAAIDGVEWLEPYVNPQFLSLTLSADEIAKKSVGQADYSKLTGLESGSAALGAEGLYTKGIHGRYQVIGVLDTGVSTGHLESVHWDIRGRVLKGYAEGFLSFSWSDPMGHGTHVAGSIMGDGKVSEGKIHGVATASYLVAQSMSGIMGFMFPPEDLYTIFQNTYADGARLHSNSWGMPTGGGQYENYSADVDRFSWDHPDYLILFAAGNSGVDANVDGVIDTGSVLAPSVAKNSLSIGASENKVSEGGIQATWGDLKKEEKPWSVFPIAADHVSDNLNGVAAFSSRGPTADGRIKPDVVAPGTNILSIRSSHPDAQLLWGAYDDYYLWSGGTSMATPLAAGSCALVRQYYSTVKGLEFISAALVKATVMNGAYDMYPGQFGFIPQKEIPTLRPNMQEGWGRIDLSSIEKPFFYEDQLEGVSVGQVKEYSFDIGSSSEPLRPCE
ncbi:MAG: S8 family serine peptidase [Deltaproteobacteria bacterium]|nr:S8 family serine peptidase [Deltaproteobacteria bacterium]